MVPINSSKNKLNSKKNGFLSQCQTHTKQEDSKRYESDTLLYKI